VVLEKYGFLILAAFISLPVLAVDGKKSPETLMMFFRSDCPPCRQEMKIIPEIAAGHTDLAIEVISLDGVRAEQYIPGMLPGNVRSAVAGAQEQEVLQHAGNGKFVLPLSVFLDKNRRICGKHQGPLGTERVGRWVATC